jgi:putative tryptophan/tyrosine transport system substrate-binding protein
MRRREIVAAISAVAAWPLGAPAQQRRVYRLGLLSAGQILTSDVPLWAAFKTGLHELGYVEGENIILEGRFAGGDVDRLPSMAGELAAMNVDAIVVFGPTPMQAAKSATHRIPIIMAAGSSDPIAEGYIASFARPGGNITGLTYAVSSERFQKQLEILKEALPLLSRVGVWWDSDANLYSRSWVPALDEAARKLGLQVEGPFLVRTLHDFDPAFAAMVQRQIEAAIVTSTSVTYENRHQAARAALQHRLPVMAAFRDSVEAGMLMSYGPNFNAIYRRAAFYVDKVFKGTAPGDIPVEQPNKYDLIINLKTASALGLTIPPTLLARADEVIE